MSASSWIALGALAVSLISIALSLWLRSRDQKKASHASLLAALQGSKEAVGYEAHRIRTDGWPKDPSERAQVREALCLAFIFERSDRSRALILDALKTASRADRQRLVTLLEDLISTFSELEREPEWDLHRAWPKIAILGMALEAPAIRTSAKRALREGIDTRKNEPNT